jgi:hypothetical protein
VLIGEGHDPAAVIRATGSRYTSAEITVAKAKGLDPGTLAVSGARVGHGYLEWEVHKFPKKKTVWV